MISLLSGFLVIYTGVYLLNLSRGDPDGHKLLNGHVSDGVPTDGITGLQTRHSMQTRRSAENGRWSMGSGGFGRLDERGRLMRQSEEQNAGMNLRDLTEDSDEDHRHQNSDGFYEEHRPLKSEDQ